MESPNQNPRKRSIVSVSTQLDPANIRTRLRRSRLLPAGVGNFRILGKDRGWTIIETLAVMTITASLLLAAMPAYQKNMERANAQNLATDLRAAVLEVLSDQSLNGNAVYTTTLVNTAIANTSKTHAGTPEVTTITANIGTGGKSYTMEAKSTLVTNFKVTFDSATGAIKTTRVGG